MQIMDLVMTLREPKGSADARRLRRTGRLPAVLYGLGGKSVSFSIERDAFKGLFEAGHRVFDLKLDKKEQLCLLKEVQFDTLGDDMVHADFMRIDEGKPVTVRVALNYIGNPDQVANAFTEFPTQDIEITCMPRGIPAHVDVNLTGLTVGSHIESGDLELPEGVELSSSPTDVVVTYHFKHAGMGEAEEPEEEEETAEPEVLTEKKPEPEENE